MSEELEDELQGNQNVNFVPCIKIVRQGVSKSNPIQIQLSRKELEALSKNSTQNSNQQNDSAESEAEEVANADDEYDMEHYSEDDELELKLNDIAILDEDDPYKSAAIDYPDSEEEDDVILPSDNLILVAHVEGSAGILEVYVYNNKDGSLYVHHDYLLPSFPLALEWLNHDPTNTNEPGNLCAVGFITPVIQVWDLDLVNCVEPAFKLGRKPTRSRARVGHKKGVLDLSWNENFHHILASGSADKTVILWDIDKSEPNVTLTDFDDKVQALKWHPQEGQTLLTGSNCCKVFDCRTSNSFKTWKVKGEVERVIWNHYNPYQFFAADGKGFIYNFDCRQEKRLWVEKAHSKEVTGLVLSSRCPGMLTTSSQDETMKIWDIMGGTPELVHESNLKIGTILCLDSAPDLAYIMASGGDYKTKNLVVFNAMTKANVKEKFQGRHLMSLSGGTKQGEDGASTSGTTQSKDSSANAGNEDDVEMS